MSPSAAQRRVVITGLGVISPLGSTPSALWDALENGRSGVAACDLLPAAGIPIRFAGEAKQFTGAIDDFGELDKDRKKAIRKGLKVMCRETQMAVAAAQLAWADAGLDAAPPNPEAAGVVLGSDYMLTMPEDYTLGIRKCTAPGGEGFEFGRWGNDGLGEMTPLWMLKYLPNMPASHIAIFNDLRGPNNSLTMREASSNLALGEAFRTIQRGHASLMIAGATGTRVLPMQAIHALQTEQMASTESEPAAASRPFDARRTGMVCGEGAGMVVLEELSAAQARGATIYAEVRGAGSSQVTYRNLRGKRDAALARAMQAALRDAELAAEDIGHVNAHGLATTDCDAQEASAIRQVFGERADAVPVTALKSYFGNLGAGSGMVELIASVLALRAGSVPAVLNYQSPDPACGVAVVSAAGTPAGRSFLKLSVTPQGQAAAVCVAAWG